MYNVHVITSVFQQMHLYKSVVNDVVTNVREAFLDEGVDEQVLHELKQVREKLRQCLTLEVLVTTIDAVGGYGGCRVGEVRAGTTSLMPDHKGFKLQ